MSDRIYLGWSDIVRNRVRIKLEQKITTTAEPFFYANSEGFIQP